MSEENKQKLNMDNLEQELTGHVWDGDLCEYNNPLPRWWLLAFYGTVIFSIGYWILFPTWPLPNSFTKGVAKIEIEKQLPDPDNPGEMKTVKVSESWNTRARLTAELQNSKEAQKRASNFAKMMMLEPEKILADNDMTRFVESAGKVIFGDNCATCHGVEAQGVIGLYPNLTDDAWLWGGEIKNIETTIRKGRTPNMTPGKYNMNENEIEDVTKYALSLSGNYTPDAATKRGEELFYSGKGSCFTCHTQIDASNPSARQPATGNPGMGAPNLTDHVWEIIDIPNMETEEEKVAAVIPHVRNGVVPSETSRIMPSWEDKLTDEQIRALAVYVYQLSRED